MFKIEAEQTALMKALARFTNLKKLSFTLATLRMQSFQDLNNLFASLKPTLTQLLVENRGNLAPSLRCQKMQDPSEIPQPYLDFCSNLKVHEGSKLEELTLLGDMGIVNFIKALINEIIVPGFTMLRRINVQEGYMTQNYSHGATDIPLEVGNDSAFTELLMQCPVLLKRVK